MRRPFAIGGALAALLLGACGFHLAGTRPLPEALQSVYVDLVTPYRVTEPPLETALRARLLRRGATLAPTAAAAATVIRLSELDERREVLSLGLDGKALEYELTTSVHYVVARGSQVIAGPDALSTSRPYSYNAQQVLAKQAEEERLRVYMQNELAELLMLRLEAKLSQPAAAAPAAPPGGAPPAP